MCKKLILSFLLVFALSGLSFGQATNWNVNGRPTSDWFSTFDTPRNVPLQWMRSIDEIVGAGSSIGTGHIFYVDANVDNEGDGSSWQNATDTLAEAIALCTDDNGDIIMVAQGSDETWSTAAGSADLDVDGVTIIGVGNGTLQPTFTMTHIDATFTVSGANCRIYNLRFVSNLDNVKVLVTMAATSDGSEVIGCTFRDSAADKDYLVGISVAALAPDVKIIGNDFRTTVSAGGNNAILSTANTNLDIIGNTIYGKFATGGVLTSGVLVSSMITDNIIVNAESAIAIALNGTTSTGVLARNFLGGTTSIAAALTGDDAMWCFENYISGAAGASGLLDPTADGDGG